MFRLNNDCSGYYRFIFTQFNDFYIRLILGCKGLFYIFSLLKFFQFFFYCLFTYNILFILSYFYYLFDFIFPEKINAEGFLKQFEESKKERGRNVFEELDEQLKKHRATVDFITKYKQEQQEKKEKKQRREESEKEDKERDIWGA